MSTRQTSSATPAFDTALFRPKKHRFLGLRLALLLALFAIVSLAEPRVFQFVVRHLVVFETWRSGGYARIDRVEGSLFEPIVLVGSVWTFHGGEGRGAVTRVEVRRITAELAWEQLLKGAAKRWFPRLSLDGVAGKIELPRNERKVEAARWMPPIDLSWLRGGWLPAPEVVEARNVDLLIASGEDFVRMQQAHFRVSEREPGVIKAGRIVVQQQWLRRTFPNVRGTTALKDSELLIARLRLEPGVEIKTFSTHFKDLARGLPNGKVEIDAFGGDIQAEARVNAESQPARCVVSGMFSQIDIGRLAAFLSRSEAAGGTIKGGSFSFHGSPHDVGRSTTWLRLDAVNFQWESRQWDSLVLGMTLIDRRLQVHECSLHQGHNELTLDGEIVLPDAQIQWWQGDFNCNVAATIENLTELSALLLPEFQFAAGRANIEGSVRGHAEKFQGHLDIEGRKLRWHDAPIEELNATLRINDNELQVAHFNIFNGDDYVRGNGVVNILGPTQYWGTLRASVSDLGDYDAILQKPIVPEPLAGGALIDWNGEGSAKGHSGKFVAQLRKLRSSGASGAQLHPINADLDGSYSADGMVFNKFALSDDESSFTANVAVGNHALSLQGIRLMHRQQLWLEGDALLPLDVWRAWPNTSLDSLLDDAVESKVTLTAYNLELGAAAKLTGWNFPISGVVNGNISAQGPIGSLKTGGRLTLANATLPLGSSHEALTSVEGEFTFAAQTATVARLVGRHPTGDFRTVGSVDLMNVRDPGLLFAIESERTELPVFPPAGRTLDVPTTLTAILKLQIEGTIAAATVRGSADLLDAQSGGARFSSVSSTAFAVRDPDVSRPLRASAIDVSTFWSEGGIAMPSIFPAMPAPWSAWRFDISGRCQPSPNTSVLSACDLHLGGTGSAPLLRGSISFENITVAAGDLLLKVTAGSLSWRDSQVVIDARASGELHGCDFVAHLFGPVEMPIHFFELSPPLSESLLSAALGGGYREIGRASCRERV